MPPTVGGVCFNVAFNPQNPLGGGTAIDLGL